METFTKIKKNSITNKGFGILEVLFAVSFFSIGIVTIAVLMIDIQNTSENSYNRNQAVLIAQQGLEAIKSIRNRENGYQNLTEGTNHGLIYSDDTKSWSLSDNDLDKQVSHCVEICTVYTRTIKITDVSGYPNTKKIESVVEWDNLSGNKMNAKLLTHLTNWQTVQTPPTEPPPGDGSGGESGGDGEGTGGEGSTGGEGEGQP